MVRPPGIDKLCSALSSSISISSEQELDLVFALYKLESFVITKKASHDIEFPFLKLQFLAQFTPIKLFITVIIISDYL